MIFFWNVYQSGKSHFDFFLFVIFSPTGSINIFFSLLQFQRRMYACIEIYMYASMFSEAHVIRKLDGRRFGVELLKKDKKGKFNLIEKTASAIKGNE